MKNTWNMTAWVVVTALVAALILTNCGGDDDGNDDDNNNGRPPYLTNGNFGETLTISGEQVYTLKRTYTAGYELGIEYTYTPYSGKALTVFTGDWEDEEPWGFIKISEVGTISESGILNLSINGAPATGRSRTGPLTEAFEDFEEVFKNITFSSTNATVTGLHLYVDVVDGESSHSLHKYSHSSRTTDSGEPKDDREEIYYGYVNKDVHVTGEGTTTLFCFDDLEYDYKYITTNFSMQFKKGWNAFCEIDYKTYNPTTNTVISNISVYMGDSSDIKWVLELIK
jgi:hypothetical protein